jgi:hypothetical protein
MAKIQPKAAVIVPVGAAAPLLMKTPIDKLQRYWQGWETKLRTLITDRSGAQLFFPAKLKQTDPAYGTEFFSLRPIEAICIYNAPTKASSTRSRNSKRLAIFIDGSFEVFPGDERPCMHKAECNVTFYTCLEDSDGVKLTFFDAIHFDFEVAESQKSFHPLFHAQRGKSRTVDDVKVKELLANKLRRKTSEIHIKEEEHQTLGTPYLRLPTPQLDMFSVMTLIMADFFCNGGEVSRPGSTVEDSFKAILRHLRDPSNIVREGFASKALKERFYAEKEQHISTAHWYAEHA